MSITHAPCFTWSGPIRFGRPTATTSTSARRVCSIKSRVSFWQTVTVALRCVSRRATGLPAISLAPTTTASAPSRSTPLASISSTAARAVQGAMSVRPYTTRPMFAGLTPSTSFSPRISDCSGVGSTPPGSGK